MLSTTTSHSSISLKIIYAKCKILTSGKKIFPRINPQKDLCHFNALKNKRSYLFTQLCVYEVRRGRSAFLFELSYFKIFRSLMKTSPCVVNLVMMKMMNYFCGMVDRRQAFSLISSRDHCQRSPPLRIFDSPQAGFEPVQNLSSGLIE